MKKIPEIFKPKIENEIRNNREVYCSFLEDRVKEKEEIGLVNENPYDTLMRLSSYGGYLFSKPVKITTKDRVYHTKIAGKMNDRIVTMDKDVILISDILAIKEE